MVDVGSILPSIGGAPTFLPSARVRGGLPADRRWASATNIPTMLAVVEAMIAI